MQEYKYLKSALGEFSTEYTVDESSESFRIMIENSPEYAKKVKEEIIEAISDTNWSWVSAALEADFVGADDDETSVWETVKVLIWPILSPDEVAPT